MSYSRSLSGHAFSKKFETELCFSICTIYLAIIFYLKLFEIDNLYILYCIDLQSIQVHGNNVYIPEKNLFQSCFYIDISSCKNLKFSFYV